MEMKYLEHVSIAIFPDEKTMSNLISSCVIGLLGLVMIIYYKIKFKA